MQGGTLRYLDQSGFNESLSFEIEKLKNMVNKVNPENVLFFPERIVPVQNFLDIWGDNSVVNSVKMSKLNALIRYLKISKLEYFYTSGKCVNNQDTEIMVPDGYDGRNSYVKLFAGGKGCVEDLSKIFNFYQGEAPFKETIRYMFQKNKNSIDISFKNDLLTEEDFITIKILFWRTI